LIENNQEQDSVLSYVQIGAQTENRRQTRGGVLGNELIGVGLAYLYTNGERRKTAEPPLFSCPVGMGSVMSLRCRKEAPCVLLVPPGL